MSKDFWETYANVCREDKRLEQEWIDSLRSQGIKAAHPDDGWVDRTQNVINFCYPQFFDNPQTGDCIALGRHESYRIVRLGERIKPRLTTGKDFIWRFEPLEELKKELSRD